MSPRRMDATIATETLRMLQGLREQAHRAAMDSPFDGFARWFRIWRALDTRIKWEWRRMGENT